MKGQKARTLSESLEADYVVHNNESSSKLAKQLANLREELNWFYSRLNRAEIGESGALQKEVKKREKQIADVTRQIASTSTDVAKNKSENRKFSGRDDLKLLQKMLGKEKALATLERYVELTNDFASLSDGQEIVFWIIRPARVTRH